jgi:hypothetical protein
VSQDEASDGCEDATVSQHARYAVQAGPKSPPDDLPSPEPPSLLSLLLLVELHAANADIGTRRTEAKHRYRGKVFMPYA